MTMRSYIPTPELKAQSLTILTQMYRWNRLPEISPKALGALVARFDAILAANGRSARDTRLSIASALAGRQINTFYDLLGGEIRAMLDEPDLAEIVKYLLEKDSDGSNDAR